MEDGKEKEMVRLYEKFTKRVRCVRDGGRWWRGRQNCGGYEHMRWVREGGR